MDRLRTQDAVAVPRQVVIIDMDSSLADAVLKMRTHGIHHLIVMCNGRVCGVVSDRDIYARGLAGSGTLLDASRSVRDVMTTVTETIDEDTDLRTALEVMHDHGVSALPLTRGGRLFGIITETDLFRVLDRTLHEDEAPTPRERGKLILANPVVQSAMNLVAQAGI